MKPFYLTINDLRIATYERPGSGIPILFVHGSGSNARAFDQMWTSNILADCHLFAFDLPGHGLSTPANEPTDYTFLKLAQLMARIIEQRIPDKLIVFAHSLGGHIAIHSMEFTDRIVALMLTGTGPVKSGADIPNAYNLAPEAMALFKNEVIDKELDLALEFEVVDTKHFPTLKNSFRASDGRCRETLGTDIGTYFSSPGFVSELQLLSKNGLKVAFLQGQHERIIKLDYLKHLEDVELWKDQVHVIPDSAHCCIFENPQAVAHLLKTFALEVSTIKK